MIFDPETLQQYRLIFLKLRAIVGPARYMMLNMIQANQGINVGELVKKSNLEQPIVSQLLSVLRKADFVYSEANHNQKNYYLNVREIEKIIVFSLFFLHRDLNTKTGIEHNYTSLQASYKILKILLNPSRMIVVDMLSKYGEKTVNEIVELTRQPQPIVSQNLSILKSINVLAARAQGRNAIYSLKEAELEHYKKALKQFFVEK